MVVLFLQRQYIHYFVNLLFPSFILSFLVLLVYFVPRSMGEKVKYLFFYFCEGIHFSDKISFITLTIE